MDDLAAVAAFSPCHFHRVFRALRLTARPIVDIALEAGYDAHESFTRAFEAIYCMSPRAFRAERGLVSRTSAPPQADLAGSVERIGPLRMVKLRHVGPYHQVGQTFQRLAAWMSPRGLFGPWTRTIGLSHDDPEVVDAARLRYDAAFLVPRPVDGEGGIVFEELAARDYLKVLHRGPYSELGQSYAGMIRHWLINETRPMPAEGSVEFYLNSPRMRPRTDCLQKSACH